jgi:ATP-dependent exoDNAse (exonuclease V) beta subunit
LPVSSWQVTSYSALAYQKDTRVGWGSKQDETVADLDEKENGFVDLEDDARWQQNIRYRLPGGTNTGDCLHKVFERLADGDELAEVLDTELRAFGLAKPEGRLPEGAELNAVLQTYQQHAVEWLQSAMSVALGQSVPALQDLFAAGCALPGMSFRFFIGGGYV